MVAPINSLLASISQDRSVVFPKQAADSRAFAGNSSLVPVTESPGVNPADGKRFTEETTHDPESNRQRSGFSEEAFILSPSLEERLNGKQRDDTADAGAEAGAEAGKDEYSAGAGIAEEGQLTDAEERQVQKLRQRDIEVRAHEQAHKAAGGQYAGAASYTYQRGPDGNLYAVGGEVSISVGRAATPRATILKSETVIRAALAPATPSSQDFSVAAQAQRTKQQAQLELQKEAVEQTQENGTSSETNAAGSVGTGFDDPGSNDPLANPFNEPAEPSSQSGNEAGNGFANEPNTRPSSEFNQANDAYGRANENAGVFANGDSPSPAPFSLAPGDETPLDLFV